MTPLVVLGCSLIGVIMAIAGFIGARTAFKTNQNTQTTINYEKSIASWKGLHETDELRIQDLEEKLESSEERRERDRREAIERDQECQRRLQSLQDQYNTVQ